MPLVLASECWQGFLFMLDPRMTFGVPWTLAQPDLLPPTLVPDRRVAGHELAL